MNPDPHIHSMYFENDRRTFARIPVASLELDRLQEKTFQTTCQEIADLYGMLRYKSIQVMQLHESILAPTAKELIH